MSMNLEGKSKFRTFLLDTNHCSRILDGNPIMAEKLNELKDSQLFICTIVRGELMFMAHNSQRREENLENVRSFLGAINCFDVDNVTADIYGRIKAGIFSRFGPRERKLRRRFRLKELGVDENDLWIAAVARRHDLTIVSADGGFRRIGEVEELDIEEWIPAVSA